MCSQNKYNFERKFPMLRSATSRVALRSKKNKCRSAAFTIPTADVQLLSGVIKPNLTFITAC